MLVLVLVPSAVLAEPIGEDTAPPCTPAELTASDVDTAPIPGDESGRVDEGPGDSIGRKVGRGALLVPKLAIEGTLAPIRGSVWAYERYHLHDRVLRLLFNDAETIGIYPVAALESQYGLNIGARFVHRDLFGEREHLGLHAGTGGRFRQVTSARLRSGDRFGPLELELEGEFEQRPRDAFYGIGNAMTVADEARFREQLLRASMIGDLRIVGPLHLRASGAIADFEFERSEDGAPIDQQYTRDTLVGFDGIRQTYGELEVRWDSRRAASSWEVASVHATGWLLAGFAGRITALDAGSDYYRLGVDLQRFLTLGRGPRVLFLRLYGGDLDEVPFTQLPRLGGKYLLRGYALDQFRDRVAAMASIEYGWDLNRYLSASAFVDGGRVFPSLRDLDVEDLRVGYGVAIEAHSRRTFLLRASLASSIDGGVFLDIAFDPVFDQARIERSCPPAILSDAGDGYTIFELRPRDRASRARRWSISHATPRRGSRA